MSTRRALDLSDPGERKHRPQSQRMSKSPKSRSPSSPSSPRRRWAASHWELLEVELTAEKAARWPMCLAIAINKTSNVRAYTLVICAVAFVMFLTYLESSEGDVSSVFGRVLNPLAVFAVCESNVLATAFVVLYPATYAQAEIDEREGVEESRTLRSLKLPAIVAEFAVGSKVACTRLARILARDFALFMTVYLLGCGIWLSMDEDPLESGRLSNTSVQEMEGGVSVHTRSWLDG